MKRFLSLLLALCMLMSTFSAFAAEPAEEPAVAETVEVHEEHTHEPVKAEEPAVEEAKAETSSAEPSKADEPVIEHPKADGPVDEEPETTEPSGEKSESNEPAEEQPVANEPAEEQPVSGEPVAEEPEANGSDIDQPEEAEITVPVTEEIGSVVMQSSVASVDACTHPNKEKNTNNRTLATERNPYSTDNGDWTCTTWYHFQWKCPDCNETWFDFSEEPEPLTEAHSWDERASSGIFECRNCKLINNCSHASRQVYLRDDRYPYDFAERAIDNQDGTHTVPKVNHITYTCPTCKLMYAEESEYITTERHFTYDGSICAICGFYLGNICFHENAVFRGETYFVSQAHQSETTDNHNGTHSFWKQNASIYECVDCGETFYICSEPRWVTEGHDQTDGVCRVCGNSDCMHRNSVQIGEPQTEIEEGTCVDAGNGYHTAQVHMLTRYRCSDCGAEYGIESGTHTEILEHVISGGSCIYCSGECAHLNAQLEYYSQPADAAAEDCGDGTHSVWYEEVLSISCSDCGYFSAEVEDTYSSTESHIWENGFCSVCGVENICPHTSTNNYRSIDYIEDRLDESVDNGNGTHSVWMQIYDVTECRDCGNAVYTPLDIEFRTERHYYNHRNICYVCGYENNCTHPAEYLTPESFPIGEQTITGRTATHHVFKAQLYTEYTCGACGQLMNTTVSDDMVESRKTHEWNYLDGTCYVCGYTCKHPVKSEYIIPAYDSEDVQIIDEFTHSVTIQQYRIMSCSICGKDFSYKTLGTPVVSTTQHQFFDDECYVCGYHVECSHENLFALDSASLRAVTAVTAKTHTAIYADETTYMCSDCGTYVCSSEGSETFEVTEKHIFNASTGECDICHYANTCKHAVKVTKKQNAAEVISTTPGAHTIQSGVYTYTECKACGQFISGSYGTMTKKTAAHTYDAYLHSCSVCGYFFSEANIITSIDIGAGITMGVGEKYVLPTVYEPAGAANVIAYNSSKATVASVDKNGVITAKATGTATITASAFGVKTTIKVTVGKAVTKVTMSKTSVTLGQGEPLQLTAKLTGASFVQEWSSDSSYVTVNQSGFVAVDRSTPVGTVATIRFATYKPNVSGKCVITVGPGMESISFDADDETLLGAGMASQWHVSVYPEDAVSHPVYSSSDTGVVTVSSTGKLTAKAAGTATITVTGYNGARAEKEITVLAAPGSLKIDPPLTMSVGQTYTLSPVLPENTMASFKFTSSAPKIAAVSADGTITAKVPGTAKITVKTHNGKTAFVNVTVKKRAQSFSVILPELGVGMSTAVKITYAPANTFIPIMSVENLTPDIIDVDPFTGVVTAKAEGLAMISMISLLSDEPVVFSQTIHPAPVEISLNETAKALAVGRSFVLKATPNEGAVGSYLFTSSNPKVASVAASGKVTGKARGTAVITVTCANNPEVTATCTVTVK